MFWPEVAFIVFIFFVLKKIQANIYDAGPVIWLVALSYILCYPYFKKYRERLLLRKEEKANIEARERLTVECEKLSVEDIVFEYHLNDEEKFYLLVESHDYSPDEARELIRTAEKEGKRAKLRDVKRKISLKANELNSEIDKDGKRQPIPDDVKIFVWNRDNGQCVICRGKENLEYDHIIPFSKGGSNTARNLQILCEKCNRSKRDNIV